MLEKYIKNNIDCCILPTMNVEIYKGHNLLLYSFKNECWKVQR